MKDKVLIANRGEIALRIMQACEELGLKAVCVYTKGDEGSLHVRLAKEKYRISDYRDMNDLLSVADHAHCTAIHPGYGFLSENYRFARRVAKRERPLTFIGPSWEAIRDLGNKLTMKRIAKDIGVPIIPGTTEPIYNELEAEVKAEELIEELKVQGIENSSLLVKAVAGGGGMGIEEVRELSELRPVFRRVRSYAKRLFGDEGIIIEAKIPVFQHLEVQILGTKTGDYVHFGTRNCTIQSPFKQKRTEIAPGFDFENRIVNVDLDLKKIEDEIISYSLRLAKHVGYDNVGTFEWLVTPDGKYYLMEVNTRIQVENEISAKISFVGGRPVNLIKEQVRTALGDRLSYTQKDIVFKGFALEFRLIAEDVKKGFKPMSGVITNFDWQDHPWLTMRTHVPRRETYVIPTQFDPNLALAIIYAETLEELLKRCNRFLSEVMIEGETSQGEPLPNNVAFLREKLSLIYQFLPG